MPVSGSHAVPRGHVIPAPQRERTHMPVVGSHVRFESQDTPEQRLVIAASHTPRLHV
jgi:hypothetical protein